MKFATLILLLILASNGLAQNNNQLTQISLHKFTDGNTTGRLHQFRHVFEGNEKDLHNLKRFNRTRHTQRAINYSLIGANIVFLGWLNSERCENCTYDFTIGFMVVTTLGTAFLGLLSNVIIIPIKLRRKNKLLNDYNGNIKPDISNSTSIILEFGTTPNGVGVTVNF